jgi:hypothetical protein
MEKALHSMGKALVSRRMKESDVNFLEAAITKENKVANFRAFIGRMLIY